MSADDLDSELCSSQIGGQEELKGGKHKLTMYFGVL